MTKHEGRENNTGRFEQVNTGQRKSGRSFGGQSFAGGHGAWNENWYEVAARFCRVDDGISNRVDRLKGLGNAIVPQVAYEIFKAIKKIDNSPNPPKEA